MIRVFNILLLVISSAFGYSQSPTVPAKNFNVFVENDLKLTTNESEGPIACGGDLKIRGNYQVAAHNAGNFIVGNTKIALLVGGRVKYESGNALQVNQNGYVKIGNPTGSNVWYYDQNNAASPIRITPTTSYNTGPMIMLQANANQLGGVNAGNNPVFQSGLLDFAAAFQQLRTNSSSIAQCSSNVQLYNPNMQPIPNTGLPGQVKIGLQNGINYLNITGTDLNNVQILTYVQQPSASKVLVINVDAPGTFNWNVWNQAGIGFNSCPYVIYNFHNTTQLNINGNSTIEGTVFAPFADINKTVNQSNIEGQVIGKSLIHSGGEIHYAIFSPSLTGCAPSGTPPTADFNINQSVQCLNNNTFIFTSTSSGANLSYLWDFGDGTTSTLMSPTKNYNTGSTYNVTLTVTNAYGSASKTKQITLNQGVIAQITQTTLNSGQGSITKQFTLTNSASFNDFSWKLPGMGSGLFPNQSIITFTFTQPGPYEVIVTGTDANGCVTHTPSIVIITSDDVSSGNDGGLESESLGDAVSKRYVNRKMQSISSQFIKSDQKIFRKGQYQARSGNSELTLLDMFPTQLTPGDIAHVSSPTDILDYTVAQEVLSVDFSIGEKTKAVVLGVRTSDKVYNHTKASCDRLRGAEILNVKTVQLNGYNFLMQAIKQRNQTVEYAISFAVGKNQADNFYSLQTNWYVKAYQPSEQMYNFQVWSTQPEYTQKLVKDILNNLNNALSLTQTEIQKMPETYVSKVYREGIDLVLDMKSQKENQSIEVNMEEVYSETNGYATRYNPVLSEEEQSLRIPIYDGYEYDGLVTVNGAIQDAFYQADGNWGLDFDGRYTTINQYQVYNNFEREYADDEWAVNRNVKLKAHSEYDYLTLYKSLLPANLPADYSEYSYLSFRAKGSGLLEIGLVKASIEQWSRQYRANIYVGEEEQTYYIPFKFFKSNGTNQKITADDLTMLTFTFLPVEAGTNDLDLEIQDVKFVKRAPAGSEDLFNTTTNQYLTYPNPSNGSFNCILYSDIASEATVTLRDVTGKLIYKTIVSLTEGRNDLNFNINISNPGLMLLNISGSQHNYGTTKILFTR